MSSLIPFYINRMYLRWLRRLRKIPEEIKKKLRGGNKKLRKMLDENRKKNSEER